MTVLLLLAPAFAQDDPWGTDAEPTPWGDDEAGDEAPAPSGEAPADPWATEAPPEAEAPVEAAAAEPAAEPLPAPAKPRGARAPGEGQATEGWRIAPFAATSGVKVGQELVVGGTGGTNATTISARWGTERFGFAVGVPFTAYRTPDGRTTDLGNLQLDGWYRLGGDGLEQTIGLELHGRVAEPAWTWTNRSDDLWPGYGADVVWQARATPGDRTALLYRASLGVHGAAGYEPFPSTYLRVSGAVGVDRALSGRVGLVGEAALSYWDLSPMELTGLVRFDPLPGIRARAGFVLPTFVWMGVTPSDQISGIRETTVVLDLTAVL